MEQLIKELFSKDLETRLSVFKTMFDAISDYIFIMKAELGTETFNYLFANKTAMENLSLDCQIYNKSLEMVLPENRVKILKKKYLEVAKTNKTIVFEDSYSTKKGEMYGETALYPILINEGKSIIIVSIVRDITKRKEKEIELISLQNEMGKNQQRMKSLIDQNSDLVYELDINGNFLSVNKKAEKVTGYSKKKIIGKSFIPFIEPKDREKVMGYFQNAINGIPQEYEINMYDSNGREVYLIINNIPILVDGKIDGVYGIAKDITDKKEMEKDLLASEERYRTLFEYSPEPILLLKDKKIIFCNKKALELFGVESLSQVQGMDAIEMIHPDDKDLTIKRNDEIFKGENLTPIDRRIITLDGKELIMEMTGKMMNFEGQPAMLISIRDVTERKKAEEKANYLAFHDDLTGLGNRRLFKSNLKKLIQLAKANKQNFAIMVLDLDNFKTINDMFGHDVGDEVLMLFSSRLRSSLDSNFVITRQGGDEIGIICPDTNKILAEEVARKILDVFNSPILTKNHIIQVHFSIGISLFPNHAEDEMTLVKHADIALYHVKNSGKKDWSFYSNEIGKDYRERLNLEEMLKEAIKNNEFSLHYQPRIDAKTGEMKSVEALIRWPHAAPDVFIPIAEDTGLIYPIGEWVTKQACLQMKDWLDKGYPFKKISINLSIYQLLNERNCTKRLKNTLINTGLPFEFVEFEITERFISHDYKTISCLQTLKDLGIAISIDDFGKEYSSLWCIKNLPIETIKLDKSFIQEINKDRESNAIIETILSLAKILSLKVCGEGVETKEQAVFLRKHGVDEFQGFLFSKAVPADDLEKLLLKNKNWLNEII
ncbi:MAG: EAL domain-containing protein [Bacillota bacterium]|nr:EAL domain-containing protein [Bacillota bacterium]